MQNHMNKNLFIINREYLEHFIHKIEHKIQTNEVSRERK